MTTLAANRQRSFELGDIAELPVIAADILYEGAAIGDNASGYMRPLVAGDSFRGFAESKVDNSAGAAGDLRVRLRRRGLVELAISGLAITDVGKAVFASDDDTFTLTQSTNSYIGRVERYVSSGVGMVAFDATKGGLGLIGELVDLTDSTGQSGTHDDTLAATTVPAAITGGESPTEAEHNAVLTLLGVMVQNQSDVAQKVKELVAQINKLARQVG